MFGASEIVCDEHAIGCKECGILLRGARAKSARIAGHEFLDLNSIPLSQRRRWRAALWCLNGEQRDAQERCGRREGRIHSHRDLPTEFAQCKMQNERMQKNSMFMHSALCILH